MKTGDKVYRITTTWHAGVRMESAVIEKITPKMIILDKGIDYIKRIHQDDNRISRSFGEAQKKFISRRESDIVDLREKIAAYEAMIEQAKALWEGKE